MKTTNRNFKDTQEDFNLLSSFFIDYDSDFRIYSKWCLVRFIDWKYGLYPHRTAVKDFWQNNAQLWFDGFGSLVAMAISEEGDSEFEIITLPGYRFLYKEILQWVLNNWGNRKGDLTTEITENQDYEIKVLEAELFKNSSEFFVREFDLTQELQEKYKLEAGFEIIDMETNPEYREQRILRSEAFSGKKIMSEKELEDEMKWHNNTHNAPIYHAYTDLYVKAKDGQHVACCEALIDAHNNCADIERVCTHSEFRRRGFARSVIQECLYRLKEIGIKKAYIAGYSEAAIGLYGSLGANKEMKCFKYVRKE